MPISRQAKTAAFYKTCEFCGEEKASRGFVAHERACARLHDHVKKFTQTKVTETKVAAPMARTVVTKTPTPFWSVNERLRVAYGIFQADAALFGALDRMLASQEDNQIENLTAARDMINLKIESLTE